jgi:hypothetical protein
LVITLSLAAFSRAEVEETKRHNFFLYMDEFQYSTTLSMANMTAGDAIRRLLPQRRLIFPAP